MVENEMFPNVRSEETYESVASVPGPDLDGVLLQLTRRRPSGTKLERRMTELEQARISKRIKEARIQSGLTQEELADLLHVRARTIANYEAGRVPWRLLGKIAEATGKTQEWLLHGELLDTELAGGDVARIEEKMAVAMNNQERVLEALEELTRAVNGLRLLVDGQHAEEASRRSPPRKKRAG